MSNTFDPNPLSQRLVDEINASDASSADPAPGVSAAIAAGAGVNVPLPNGATPLMWAIANQKKGAVRALLDAKPDLAMRDEDGDTAITIAARFAPKDDLLILEMVLAAGANPNARTPGGDPAITWLTRSFKLDGIRLMARYRADLNARTRTSTPLIIEAALVHAWDVVHTLIECGADPLVDDEGRRVAGLLNCDQMTGTDSPLFPWKVKVWHHLAACGEKLSPLPDAS